MLAPNQENALQKLSQSEAHHKLGIHWGGLTRDFGWVNSREITLGFDHALMLADAKRNLRARLVTRF